MNTNNKCPICDSGNNAFVTLNDGTAEYSNIEMSLNRQGMLRCRTYADIIPQSPEQQPMRLFESQDVVNVNYCPICGRKFKIQEGE